MPLVKSNGMKKKKSHEHWAQKKSVEIFFKVEEEIFNFKILLSLMRSD